SDLLWDVDLPVGLNVVEAGADRAGRAVVFGSTEQQLQRAAGRLHVSDALGGGCVGADHVDGQDPSEDRNALQDDARGGIGRVHGRVRLLEELLRRDVHREQKVDDVAGLDGATGGLRVGDG